MDVGQYGQLLAIDSGTVRPARMVYAGRTDVWITVFDRKPKAVTTKLVRRTPRMGLYPIRNYCCSGDRTSLECTVCVIRLSDRIWRLDV